MWHMQLENTPGVCATTAGNVLSLIRSRKTGEDSKFVKPTTSQKNRSLIPFDIVVTPLHCMSLAQIVLSQWTYLLLLPGIALSRVLEVQITPWTCGHTQKPKISSGLS
jgi:hypothetical protein